MKKGFDHKFGARPLRRAIQKYIEDPLAEEILRGKFKEGSNIITKHVQNTEDLVFFDESLEHPDPNVEPEKSDTGGNFIVIFFDHFISAFFRMRFFLIIFYSTVIKSSGTQ